MGKLYNNWKFDLLDGVLDCPINSMFSMPINFHYIKHELVPLEANFKLTAIFKFSTFVIHVFLYHENFLCLPIQEMVIS